MAKTKVTTKFDILELIDGFLDGTTEAAIGDTIVSEAKRMISEGQSPVRGEGRFAQYKNRASYPGKLKPAQPVNLELTGAMLDGYDWKHKSPNSIVVGMIKGTDKSKEVAGYHQEGTEKMAKRRIVPDDTQEFAVSIMRAIRDIYGTRLASLINKSNKK